MPTAVELACSAERMPSALFVWFMRCFIKCLQRYASYTPIAALHRQASKLVAASGGSEIAPQPQEEHASRCPPTEYCPSGHGVHGSVLEAYDIIGGNVTLSLAMFPLFISTILRYELGGYVNVCVTHHPPLMTSEGGVIGTYQSIAEERNSLTPPRILKLHCG